MGQTINSEKWAQKNKLTLKRAKAKKIVFADTCSAATKDYAAAAAAA